MNVRLSRAERVLIILAIAAAVFVTWAANGGLADARSPIVVGITPEPSGATCLSGGWLPGDVFGVGEYDVIPDLPPCETPTPRPTWGPPGVTVVTPAQTLPPTDTLR